MFINAHTHIFNMRTALTDEMERMILDRLKGHRFEKVLRPPLKKILKRVRNEQQGQVTASSAPYLSPYAEFVKEVLEQPALAALLNAEGLDADAAKGALERSSAEVESSDSPDAAAAMAAGFIDSLLKPRFQVDVENSEFGDYTNFIRIAFSDSVDKVCIEALAGIKNEGILVALPMDVIASDATVKDRALYRWQMDETVRQARRTGIKGRVLPFFMVNAHRPDVTTMMEEYLESGSCVGIKLYPSLGYKIKTPTMKKVVAYADTNEVPLLIHCNGGGFKKSDEWAKQADPQLWEAYLAEFKSFKICFAHFGGDEHLTSPASPEGVLSKTWSDKIIELIKKYPGRVYTDISFHTAGMEPGKNTDGKLHRTAYFAWLKSLMADKKVANGILFGTDYFLVRQRASDRSIYDWYQEYGVNGIGKANWDKLTSSNAAEFLGFKFINNGSGYTPMSKTMRRHAVWLNSGSSSGAPTYSATTDGPIGGVISAVAIAGSVESELPTPVLSPLSWDPVKNRVHERIATYFLHKNLRKRYHKAYNDMLDELSLRDQMISLGGLSAVDFRSLTKANSIGALLLEYLRDFGHPIRQEARDIGWNEIAVNQKIIQRWLGTTNGTHFPMSEMVLGSTAENGAPIQGLAGVLES